MEALEYIFEAMAGPVKLRSVLRIEHLRVSSEHLNYKKHSMVRLLYRFHIYYHIRRVLKRLQVSLPCESGFNAPSNPYSGEGLFKLCEDYGAPHDSIGYWDTKFFWMYQ